jgi:DNA polymerase III subunit delta
MKAVGAEAALRLAASAEDRGRAGFLLYGADAMQVALARQAVVAALAGPDGEAEMRVERLAAGDLRRDPAALGDALRARGFFPGPRVVVVEGAAEAAAPAVLDALAARRPGDAVLVAAAGALPARSALRKGFETAASAVAVALYPDPPSRSEIEAALAGAGVAAAPDAVEALTGLAAEHDPGAFARLIETLALYRLDADGAATAEDVAAIAPGAGEPDIDLLLDRVAAGDPGAAALLIRRLAARGAAPTTLAIAAARHFRALHAAASARDNAEAALARLRPPVFGPRRARMAEQARRLGQPGVEKALGLLTDADLALRSSRPVPGMALIERTLIHIAVLARR